MLLACAFAANAQVVTAPVGLTASVPAFSAMAPGAATTGWRFAGLPSQKIAPTRFDVVDLGGKRVLRVQADASYGALLWDAGSARLGQGALLRWSWQLERGLAQSDLSRKEGDDSPLKLCASFDMPLDGLPFAERTKLRMARALSGQDLPSATLCYVWDHQLPHETLLDNAYTRRVRMITLRNGRDASGQWFTEQRDIAADFRRAFGDESAELLPVSAVLVGADSDNTGVDTLAFVADLRLAP